MTTDEAKTVVRIMMTADGGCSHCVEELLEQFEEAFPVEAGVIETVFAEERADELLEEIEDDAELDNVEESSPFKMQYSDDGITYKTVDSSDLYFFDDPKAEA